MARPQTSRLQNSSFVIRADVAELQRYQAELQRLLREVDPQAGLGETMKLAVGMLHRKATGVVHVDTGRLKNSLFWDVGRSGRSAVGLVGTNVMYSIFEERRGGSHAFMDRTQREEGPAVERLFHVRISGGQT